MDNANVTLFDYIEKAKEYYSMYGTYNIPYDYVTGEGIRLGDWRVITSRKIRIGTNLDSDVEMLNSIEWQNKALCWTEWIELSKLFISENDTLIHRNSIYNGYDIGAWFFRQLSNLSKLPEDRRNLFISVCPDVLLPKKYLLNQKTVEIKSHKNTSYTKLERELLSKKAEHGLLSDDEVEKARLIRPYIKCKPLFWDEWFALCIDRLNSVGTISKNSKVYKNGVYYLGEWLFHQAEEFSSLSLTQKGKISDILFDDARGLLPYPYCNMDSIINTVMLDISPKNEIESIYRKFSEYGLDKSKFSSLQWDEWIKRCCKYIFECQTICTNSMSEIYPIGKWINQQISFFDSLSLDQKDILASILPITHKQLLPYNYRIYPNILTDIFIKEYSDKETIWINHLLMDLEMYSNEVKALTWDEWYRLCYNKHISNNISHNNSYKISTWIENQQTHMSDLQYERRMQLEYLLSITSIREGLISDFEAEKLNLHISSEYNKVLRWEEWFDLCERYVIENRSYLSQSTVYQEFYFLGKWYENQKKPTIELSLLQRKMIYYLDTLMYNCIN